MIHRWLDVALPGALALSFWVFVYGLLGSRRAYHQMLITIGRARIQEYEHALSLVRAHKISHEQAMAHLDRNEAYRQEVLAEVHNSCTFRVFRILYVTRDSAAKRILNIPPGSWLLNLADNVCRKATLDLLRQMVADMRVEHFEALRDGRKIRASWVKALHYFSMAHA